MKRRLASGNGEKRGFFLPVAHSAFRQEGRARPRAACLAAGALTPARVRGMLKAPNPKSHNRRLALAPQGAKVLSVSVTCHARAVSGAGRVHIGRVQRPDAVRLGRLTLGPGSVAPCLFYSQTQRGFFMYCDFINGLQHRTDVPKFIDAKISENFMSELLNVQYGLEFLAKATSDLEEYSHNGGIGRKKEKLVNMEVLSGAAYVAHLLSLRLDAMFDEVKTDDD